ncbi:hypothetical protein CRM22_002948 [Opisthorchis felineus]|uniref:Uncharacterized protein n=1 Tax=Opisthorchis felineus TaxID=147828 RepID=A0A4S2M3K2_OPIFE|nr:hypothetical protein CRM22_002948 [Opisthorchis felineus]
MLVPLGQPSAPHAFHALGTPPGHKLPPTEDTEASSHVKRTLNNPLGTGRANIRRAGDPNCTSRSPMPEIRLQPKAQIPSLEEFEIGGSFLTGGERQVFAENSLSESQMSAVSNVLKVESSDKLRRKRI